MKKFKLLSLLLIISLFTALLPVPALALDDPVVSAQAAVLMDADTGDVLYELNGDQAFAPGGLTMLMSSLLVAEQIDLRNISLVDDVTASENFRSYLSDSAATANPAIVPGETLTVEDLLYCSLLLSASDASIILAEHVGGTVENFVATMNERAAELGCTNSHFANPNGQAAEGHYSSAHDLALISRELVSSAPVLAVCGSPGHTVEATEAAGTRTLTNINALLTPGSDYYYPEAYGLKTGYSPEVGQCLVAAANWNDMNIIAVVLGCPSNGDQFRDAVTLFDWVFANFSYRSILSSTATLATLPVELGNPANVGVRPETQISVILQNDQELGDISYSVTYLHEAEGRTLTAPIAAGEHLGEVTVYMDGVEYGTSRLVAASTSEISRLEYMRTQIEGLPRNPAIRQIVTVLIIVLAIYLLLVLIYLIQRLRHLHSLRVARKDRAISQAQQEAEWLDDPGDTEDDYYDDPGVYDGGRDGRYDDAPQQPPPPSGDGNYFDTYFKQ